MWRVTKVGCQCGVWRSCCTSNKSSFVRFGTSSQSLQKTQNEDNSSAPEVSHPKKIEIPVRKKRDEYSILRALASTVSNDLSAPHFKFTDDPFLIPTSNLDKRTFALAKASGQKAAKYVINRYPGNFAHNPAEPSVEAFLPPTGFISSADTLEGLQERIDERKPIASFESYQKILDAGVEVPQPLVEDLLDLLCFFNSDDPSENLLIDELFFHRDVSQDNTPIIRKEWKDEGAAETLFMQMKDPSIRASCSIIRGRAKYFQLEKAFDEFRRLRDKGIKVDVATYTAIIPVAIVRKDHPEARWNVVQELLRDMASSGLTPELETFNSVLFVLSRSSRFTESRSWFMQTINEMRSCNIEPSLSSWYYGLHVFYCTEQSRSQFLHDVIEYLKDKPIVVRESTDYEFFSCAMIKCFMNVKDLQLAYKINDLFVSANNSDLLGDSFREGLYYTHFLRILCLYETIDKVMETYNHLTPHKYTPTFTVMDELLNAIQLTEGYEHLPKIWSDIVLFQYTKRVEMLEKLLELMACKKQTNQQLQQLFVKTAYAVVKQAEKDASNRKLINRLSLTGQMIGDLAAIHLNADDFKSAWETMQLFVSKRHETNGFPSEESLVRLAEAAVQRADVDKTIQLLSLMSDFGYPKLDELVDRVKSTLTLTDHQRSHLDDLV